MNLVDALFACAAIYCGVCFMLGEPLLEVRIEYRRVCRDLPPPVQVIDDVGKKGD